jgi:transcriptional regulator with XRE-family HTH domain
MNYVDKFSYNMGKTSAQKFGENMKKIRLEKGMSQGDICRALGLDRAYISNVENGKQNLTLSTMEKVAKVLGVSLDQLLK